MQGLTKTSSALGTVDKFQSHVKIHQFLQGFGFVM